MNNVLTITISKATTALYDSSFRVFKHSIFIEKIILKRIFGLDIVWPVVSNFSEELFYSYNWQYFWWFIKLTTFLMSNLESLKHKRWSHAHMSGWRMRCTLECGVLFWCDQITKSQRPRPPVRGESCPWALHPSTLPPELWVPHSLYWKKLAIEERW